MYVTVLFVIPDQRKIKFVKAIHAFAMYWPIVFIKLGKLISISYNGALVDFNYYIKTL